MDQLKDFSSDLSSIGDRLRQAEETRRSDDQDIIDVLNYVCYKMSVKFNL